MNREDWDRRYGAAELVWSAEPNRFLVAEVSALDPGRALDLAAGEGRNAVWLAERGWRVTAVDFSGVGLEKGRRLARRRGVEVVWVQADLRRHVPPAASFDLVILLYLHLGWAAMRGVLRRASRAVAPGGTFLLVGHDRSNLRHGHGGPRDERVLYTADAVSAALEGLEVVSAGRRERPVKTEHGPAAAIDCLVRARRVADA